MHIKETANNTVPLTNCNPQRKWNPTIQAQLHHETNVKGDADQWQNRHQWYLSAKHTQIEDVYDCKVKYRIISQKIRFYSTEKLMACCGEIVGGN